MPCSLPRMEQDSFVGRREASVVRFMRQADHSLRLRIASIGAAAPNDTNDCAPASA